MNYWKSLDDRERLLLMIAGALVFVLALWFLAFRPVMKAKAAAQTTQSMALRDLEIVQTNLPKLSGAQSAKTGSKPFNRNAVVNIAKSHKLAISRVQPENDGSLKVWFDDANTAQILKFMNVMTRDYAAAISIAQITRKNNGKVSTTLTFRPLT